MNEALFARLTALTAAVGACFVVTACGGGSDEPAAAPVAVATPAPAPAPAPAATPAPAPTPAPATSGYPDGALPVTAYAAKLDSPFDGLTFTYFNLKDWSDGVIAPVGVITDASTLSSSFGASLVDSVDEDDGVVDGQCSAASGRCDALWGNGSIEFKFDAVRLSALPTHVGVVCTDSGGNRCTLDVYDNNNVLLGTLTANLASDITANVTEDRFMGWVHAAGISRIVLKSDGGGVEADHLQYGRL